MLRRVTVGRVLLQAAFLLAMPGALWLLMDTTMSWESRSELGLDGPALVTPVWLAGLVAVPCVLAGAVLVKVAGERLQWIGWFAILATLAGVFTPLMFLLVALLSRVCPPDGCHWIGTDDRRDGQPRSAMVAGVVQRASG